MLAALNILALRISRPNLKLPGLEEAIFVSRNPIATVTSRSFMCGMRADVWLNSNGICGKSLANVSSFSELNGLIHSSQSWIYHRGKKF